MSMADMYWDQPTGASQELPEEQRPMSSAESPPDEPAPEAPAANDAPATTTTELPASNEDAALRVALSRIVLGDTAGWRAALRDAGFSEAEAGRLIFERLRPRDEGRGRQS